MASDEKMFLMDTEYLEKMKHKKQDNKENLKMIFKGKKIIQRDQFVLNCFDNKSILGYLGKLEKQLNKYTDEIEKKYATSPLNYPLNKTNHLEKTEIPKNISFICEKLSQSIRQKNFDIEKELHTMNQKEMINCESIVNCIGSGYIEDLDFSEIPFIILLNSLKVILRHLPETLFTNLISSKFISVDIESYVTEKLLRDVLEKVPRCNYNTIKCVSKVMHELFQICVSKTSLSLSAFFVSCFFQINDPQEMSKATYFIRFLFDNALEFFKFDDFQESSGSSDVSSERKKSILGLGKNNIKRFKKREHKVSTDSSSSDIFF